MVDKNVLHGIHSSCIQYNTIRRLGRLFHTLNNHTLSLQALFFFTAIFPEEIMKGDESSYT